MERETGQARTLNAVMFSLGLHVSFLASILWVGAQLRVRTGAHSRADQSDAG